jgi:hypothetical protein
MSEQSIFPARQFLRQIEERIARQRSPTAKKPSTIDGLDHQLLSPQIEPTTI